MYNNQSQNLYNKNVQNQNDFSYNYYSQNDLQTVSRDQVDNSQYTALSSDMYPDFENDFSNVLSEINNFDQWYNQHNFVTNERMDSVPQSSMYNQIMCQPHTQV